MHAEMSTECQQGTRYHLVLDSYMAKRCYGGRELTGLRDLPAAMSRYRQLHLPCRGTLEMHGRFEDAL
jgi:hypothetical protein